MNKILPVITVALLLGLAITACAQNNKKNNTEMKTLVAYFSATGTTKALAQNLSEVVHGDLYEITPEQPYTAADLDWHDENSRSSIEMNKDKSIRPAIKGNVENMDQYEVVYVGFPIWWYVAPTIINTFLESYNFEGKKVITFATSGGSPMGKTLDSLKPSAPKANWVEGKVLNHASKKDIEAWVNSIK